MYIIYEQFSWFVLFICWFDLLPVLYITSACSTCDGKESVFPLTWMGVSVSNRFKGSANVQHIDLKIPLFRRGGISEDLKSILITVCYSSWEVFVHLPCPSPNFVYRFLESTLMEVDVDVNSHYAFGLVNHGAMTPSTVLGFDSFVVSMKNCIIYCLVELISNMHRLSQ